VGPIPSAPDQTPVEWFVAQLAKDLELGDRAVDLRCRRILFRLARWAMDEGLPLDREVILDPATVERFCQLAMAGDRSAATHRSDLRRMGPILTKVAPWEPRPYAMATRKVAPPYDPTELQLVQADAANQPSPTGRRAARAFLALGLGAGLDGRWVGSVTAHDVRRRDELVEVRVGPPSPRWVVVRGNWEREVFELARSAGTQYLIGGTSESRHRVASKVKRLVHPTDHPALSPARLRSTWLVDHLAMGTRLPELCRAAGFEGLTTLTDLLSCVPTVHPTVADSILRGDWV
jgi:hypothetical protein